MYKHHWLAMRSDLGLLVQHHDAVLLQLFDCFVHVLDLVGEGSQCVVRVVLGRSTAMRIVQRML
jgi:hypothetical protein